MTNNNTIRKGFVKTFKLFLLKEANRKNSSSFIIYSVVYILSEQGGQNFFNFDSWTSEQDYWFWITVPPWWIGIGWNFNVDFRRKSTGRIILQWLANVCGLEKVLVKLVHWLAELLLLLIEIALNLMGHPPTTVLAVVRGTRWPRRVRRPAETKIYC